MKNNWKIIIPSIKIIIKDSVTLFLSLGWGSKHEKCIYNIYWGTFAQSKICGARETVIASKRLWKQYSLLGNRFLIRNS
jgi:hypothetical protein